MATAALLSSTVAPSSLVSCRLSSPSALSRPSPARHSTRLCVRADSQQQPEQNEGAGQTIPDSESPRPTLKTPKVSTSFSDVFAFSGPAPETINGRLAMLGFAAAMGVEAATGHPLVSQIEDGPGAAWFILTGLLITAASLVPMFKGVTAESKSGGIMSAQAEIWNGRAAMIGLVALAVTEYVKAGPLI